MKLKFSLITFLAIFISACSTIKRSAPLYSDSRINNISWAVVSFKGTALHQSNFPNGMPQIIFNMQDGKISGSDGCNSFMGIAAYTATTIKPGAIASTKAFCSDGGFENEFFEVLASPRINYRLNDDILRLYVNDAEVMALKEKE